MMTETPSLRTWKRAPHPNDSADCHSIAEPSDERECETILVDEHDEVAFGGELPTHDDTDFPALAQQHLRDLRRFDS